MTTEQIAREIAINNQVEKNWQKRFDFILDLSKTEQPREMIGALAILAASALPEPSGQVLR